MSHCIKDSCQVYGHTHCGGFRWLQPVSMSVVSWRRPDVVECLGLKLCLYFAGERNSLIEGKMSALRTLADGHSSEMGAFR